MASTLMVRLYMYLKGQKDPYSSVTSFIPPNNHIWGFKDNITKVFITNLFNIEAQQPLPIEHLDVEGMKFQVVWDGGRVPNSEVLTGDVKELMEIMKSRNWRDVLEVNVVFDPAIKTGLKTMSEGDRAWAPITVRVDEERARKMKFAAMKEALEESD